MDAEFLSLLRCPKSGQKLKLESRQGETASAEPAHLVSEDGQHRYPVHGGIPRFVAESNYADNFGMQWNRFRQTQLDSHSGLTISADRFWLATGWSKDDLRGQWVLDAGCGAGRFAEIALAAGAKVVALDYSSAVEACHANLKQHPHLHVIQADIYALPLAPGQFPFVYSLGVLQHTPDVGKAFAALPPMLRGGGRLCVDYYWKRLRTLLHAKYLVRPITTRMTQPKLFSLLQRWVPTLLRVSQLLGRVPVLGRVLKRIIPVADYTGIFPLSAQQLQEWALLDTFDMLAPAYDNPQSEATVRQWLLDAGLNHVETGHWGHLVGRGVKPAA